MIVLSHFTDLKHIGSAPRPVASTRPDETNYVHRASAEASCLDPCPPSPTLPVRLLIHHGCEMAIVLEDDVNGELLPNWNVPATMPDSCALLQLNGTGS